MTTMRIVRRLRSMTRTLKRKTTVSTMTIAKMTRIAKMRMIARKKISRALVTLKAVIKYILGNSYDEMEQEDINDD